MFIYSQGVSDYLSYPILVDELSIRTKSTCLLHSVTQSTNLLVQANADQQVSTEKLISKTCHYLINHLNHPHSLNKLAATMATNRNVLTRVFKENTGVGAMTWLRAERMAKAKCLLSHGYLTIQQVSYEVGYEDPANFATAFKRHYKLSPSYYRKITIAKKNQK
ncbi:MAG: AraC-like DNA-binding protein [Alteromonadaceae bacterium]